MDKSVIELVLTIVLRSKWSKVIKSSTLPTLQSSQEDDNCFVRFHLTCTLDPFRAWALFGEVDDDWRVTQIHCSDQPNTQALSINKVHLVTGPLDKSSPFHVTLNPHLIDLSRRNYRNGRLKTIADFVELNKQCSDVNLSGNLITAQMTHKYVPNTSPAYHMKRILSLSHVHRVDLTYNPIDNDFLDSLNLSQLSKVIIDTSHIKDNQIISHHAMSRVERKYGYGPRTR